MVGETEKTNILRGKEFFRYFCRGSVIDIGGGDSPVTPEAYVFDLEQGDAQNILNYLDAESFDCVYSSHCLEHMHDVNKAIQQWWSLVRPTGYLIIVVPDEDLYEQGAWPSQFNSDHKFTFTIDKKESWSPTSVNLKSLVCSLESAELVSIELQDFAYDYNLESKRVSPLQYSLWDYRKSRGCKRILKKCAYMILYYPTYVWSNRLTGSLIDQTRGVSLAQIQAIVRKVR